MSSIAISRDKPSSDSRFKLFLNNHCYIVDFFSASIVICLCLIVLLPRVHESFTPHDANHLPTGTGSVLVLATLPTPDDDHNQHHHHGFPAGEFLICVGFFVFYCAGMGMKPHQHSKSNSIGTQQQVVISPAGRRQSVCCSSTRCPSSQPKQGEQQAPTQTQRTLLDESTSILSPETLTLSTEDDCVMLLNRHHKHHTHNRHHDHNHATMIATHTHGGTIQQTYGATGRTTTRFADTIMTAGPRGGTTIIVDEIRIISEPTTRERRVKVHWPHSLKMLIFSVILAVFLIFFDMNVLGMLRAIKVFRACSTGALLYVAFFIMLPRDSASCKPCEDEET